MLRQTDLLNTVRHLKDLGIEVRFEKENINKANPPDVFIHFVALLQGDTVANFGGNKL